MITSTSLTKFLQFAVLALLLPALPGLAQNSDGITGTWVVNSDLSDNTDKKVEQALRAMGQRPGRCWIGCKEDRFRGGPKEQELYDRISYDRNLTIEPTDSGFLFTYNDEFQRPVYTDGRRQTVSLNSLDKLEDFSFGQREGNRLSIEARPRDGGFANETYSLVEGGRRLRVEMYIKPGSFTQPIEMVRIYDRVVASTN